MPSNVIPASIATPGPFQSFPNEIIIEILKYLLMIKAGKSFGEVVEGKWFPFIFAMGTFKKIRHISKTFNDLAIIAFYEGNIFNFRTGNPNIHYNASWNMLPPPLPPLAVRGYLRHISIDTILEDYFYTDHPAGYTPLHRADRQAQNFFVTVSQLFEYSPCARQLRDLAQQMRGLEVLNLNITADFQGADPEAAVAVFKAAAFKLRAGKVTVMVKAYSGASHYWHQLLVEAITVE